MLKRCCAALLALAFCLIPWGLGEENPQPDYALEESWVYCESEPSDQRADVFFVPTTASSGKDGLFTVDLTNESRVAKIVGVTNMEKGIYDADCRFFAPFYRQASLIALNEPGGVDNEYFDLAYEDVHAAFLYYLEHYNGGRPIVLAGFSQGGILCVRLLKEFFGDPELQSRLVACYAVGWRVTEEELAEYPQLRMAQGEADTGVIIAYTGEAEDVTDSPIVPKGTKALSINPLNWKTDATPAGKEENLGACFTDYDGAITSEIPALTGAYIDPERGTLKIMDVTAEEYPGVQFPDGIFHVYDCSFFYRNLQKNVQTRIDAYFDAQ